MGTPEVAVHPLEIMEAIINPCLVVDETRTDEITVMIAISLKRERPLVVFWGLANERSLQEDLLR